MSWTTTPTVSSRTVDEAVIAYHSRQGGLPVLLAALPEYHRRFRSISRNPLLAEGAIDVNPDDLAADMLRKRAWQAMLPRYRSASRVFPSSIGSPKRATRRPTT